MKKYRVIFIHDTKLRRIRDNLRFLISQAVRDRIESLRALREGILWKDNGSQSEHEKQLDYYAEILDLQEALKKSICMCGTCQRIENDMIYIPSLKAWHCVKCDTKNLIWYPAP